MQKAATIVLALILFLTGCNPAQSISVPVPEPDYWPTVSWQSSTPEAQGMDSVLLADMLDDLAVKQTRVYSLVVIRNGYLVTEAYAHPYTRDTKTHVQSITKSVIGMLVGKAIGMGAIKSADETLVSYFPGRVFANPSDAKNSIRLTHLLSMASGLDCAEFTANGPTMEQSTGWVQFMLDLPVTTPPGKQFGYCNGNAHLLSAILEKSTGLTARDLANQELFGPLGIPPVDAADWGADPKGYTTGGYGLHLKPLDLAKLALLNLQNGKWEGQQIIPASWIAASTTQQVLKEDGSGYGYLWTVYPKAGHYAALGLGGQQVHVYPKKNLIVVVTAGLESYAEAPEIETMLNQYILPAVKSDQPLKENEDGLARLQSAVEKMANPEQPVPDLPAAALDISGSTFNLSENPVGWQSLQFVFQPGAKSAQLILNGAAVIEIGLDHLFRKTTAQPFGELFLRGRWADGSTFVVDYPYPISGGTRLGELGETEIRFKFSGDALEVTITPLIFGGNPFMFTGQR